MGKSKKKTQNKNNTIKESKSRRNKIIALISGILVVAVAAVIIIFSLINSSKYSQFCDYVWTPTYAKNASGDEVEMAEVYNTKYSSYQGSLSFKSDGTFQFWLSPGSSLDGTHSGTYSISDNSEIDVTFDDGTQTSFTVEYKDNKADCIKVNYNGYDVYFYKQN